MKRAFYFYTLVFCLLACWNQPERNPVMLGNWQGVEWIREDSKVTAYLPSSWTMDASKAKFEFREDGTFTATWGDRTESGTWQTKNDQLFLKETGKQSLTVKLIKTEPDALEFEMIFEGKKETLKLIKIKS